MNPNKIVAVLVATNIILIATIIFIFVKLNELDNLHKTVDQTQKTTVTSEKTTTSDFPSMEANKISDQKGELININADGFNPKGIQIYSGQKMELAVVNDDKTSHSFNIDELGIKTGAIEPGKTLAVIIDNLPANSIAYEYYSDIAADKKNDKFHGTIMILKK